MKTRLLEQGNCVITQNYSKAHEAVDIIGENPRLDYVLAHSDGEIVLYQDGYDNIKGSVGNISYGNFVKIKHSDGYFTLYAHMQKSLLVKSGKVKKGQRIGYMSDSGNANGKHLHFEVWKGNDRINPINYLNSDFSISNVKYKLGDIVTINGVYTSSDSDNKLIPSLNRGVITRIVENAKNPYLLDNGRLGWVNDSVIVKTNYLSNNGYSGNSIVEALNEINVDSSFAIV